MPYSLFSPDTLEGLRAAMAEAESGDQGALEACRQVASAVRASDAGDSDLARATLDAALTHTQDLRLLYLGFQFHVRSGNHDEAERLTLRRLDLAPPESADAARAWTNLGLVFFLRKGYDQAESAMQRALDIDTRIGHDFGIARDLGNLSLIPEARGDLDAAERLNQQALAIARRINAAPIIGTRLFNLAEIAVARARPDLAREFWQEARAALDQAGETRYRDECDRRLDALPAPPGV